jgi:hypothetical protein
MRAQKTAAAPFWSSCCRVDLNKPPEKVEAYTKCYAIQKSVLSLKLPEKVG